MHAPAPNAFVVRTDRHGLDRFFRPRVVVMAICLAFIVVCAVLLVVLAVSQASSAGSLPATAPALVVVAVALIVTSTMQIASMLGAWRGLRGIDVRVVADDAGLRATVPDASVHVVWDAVRSARLLGSGPRRRLVVDVDPRALPDGLAPRARRRIARHGLLLVGLGMQPGIEVVANAVAVGTRGRVQATAH